MRRRDNLAHLILVSVVALDLTLLMVVVETHAQIAFMSDRNWRFEIYVMAADGGNPQNLTNNPHGNANPAWLNSPFPVSPTGKRFTIWGRLKQVD